MPSLAVCILTVVLLALSAMPLLVAWRSATDRRRQLAALTALRSGALLLLALALANPAWLRASGRLARPPLVILQDASASVGASRRGGPDAAAQAQAALHSPAVRDQLQRFSPIFLSFGGGLVVPSAGVPSEPATDLATALAQAGARVPATPVVVISDGAETAGQAHAAAARLTAGGSPVYTVGIGPTQPPDNLGPLVIQAPRVVREKQPVPVRALLRATGYSGPQPVQLELDGKPVTTLSAALSPGAVTTLRHQLPGLSAGVHVFTVRTSARSGEANAADNTRSQLIEARRDATRLVLLAGAPDPDYAALQRLLGRLPKVQAASYVRVGPGRVLRQTGGQTTHQAPQLPQLLRDAHVLILMDFLCASADAAAIRAFVQSGGALGWLAGPHARAGDLTTLLPARPGPYAAVPTGLSVPASTDDLGRDLARATTAAWWTAAPFLSGLARVDPAPGSTVVLRTAQRQPLLVTGTAGRGSTLFFAATGTARWLLSPQADEASRRLHATFWQTLLGWLSQPREQRRLVVMLDPPIVPEGQPLRLLAALPGGGVKVRAEVSIGTFRRAVQLAPTGTQPGQYAAMLSDLVPGKYMVRFVGQVGGTTLVETRQLVVEPGGVELAEPVQQVGHLRTLAAAGGGEYAPVEQLASLLARITPRPSVNATAQPFHPFRTAFALAAIVVLLSSEWFLRRRWGW